jgi:hypothetical protein
LHPGTKIVGEWNRWPCSQNNRRELDRGTITITAGRYLARQPEDFAAGEAAQITQALYASIFDNLVTSDSVRAARHCKIEDFHADPNRLNGMAFALKETIIR